jgi:hypothetical protein
MSIPAGTTSTAGFVTHRADYGSWRTRTRYGYGYSVRGYGYGVHGYGYGVGFADPSHTRAEPY